MSFTLHDYYYEDEASYLDDHFNPEHEYERQIQDKLDEEAHINFLEYLESLEEDKIEEEVEYYASN